MRRQRIVDALLYIDDHDGDALLPENISKTARYSVPYYGEAKTAASAALAVSMGFEQLSPAKAVFEIKG